MQAIGTLDSYPRRKLAAGPTPIEDAPRLSAALGGPRILVKRDDLTGLAFGGNKIRQLEFYLGAAEAEGCDTLLITGAVQSNFVRAAAAAAARCGLACHVQLEERVPDPDETHRHSGNVLLDRLLGAVLHSYPRGEDEAGADARLEEIAAELREAGARPYVIHLGPGHPPLGALGYVDAARETAAQLAALDLRVDEIVCPSGSAATHAGLLAGLHALGSATRLTGICVRRPAALQAPRVAMRAAETAELLGLDPPPAADVHLLDDTLAPGYGRLNPATMEALALAAATEGLILDPVYTAKAMAGLIAGIRRGDIARNSTVLFVHTGGQPALFAYEPAMRHVLAKDQRGELAALAREAAVEGESFA